MDEARRHRGLPAGRRRTPAAGRRSTRRSCSARPEWLDAVRHAAAEAERLGLEMDDLQLAGLEPHRRAVGEAGAGDEEARVERDRRARARGACRCKLPQPPSNNGPIRNLARGGNPSADPTFYGDGAVIAYRTPADERDVADAATRRSPRTPAPADGAALLDDDLNSALTVAAAGRGTARMDPVRVRRAVHRARADRSRRAAAAFRSAACWRATTARVSARSSRCPARSSTGRAACDVRLSRDAGARLSASSSPARR